MSKIKLPLQNIREFIALSSKIDAQKNPTILSTGQYIKLSINFDELTLVKHNAISFIHYAIALPYSEQDIECLIHEEIFRRYVNSIPAKAQFLYLKIEETETKLGASETFVTVKLFDNEKMSGKGFQSFKYSKHKVDINTFPSTEIEQEGSKTRLMEDELAAIQVAKTFVSSDELQPALTALYLTTNDEGFGELYSFNNFIAYTKKFKLRKFPQIAITLKEASMLDAIGKVVDYVVTDSHNLYFLGSSVVFGFRRGENMDGYDRKRYYNPHQHLNNNNITLESEQLMLFCTRAKNLSESISDGSSFVNSSCLVSGIGVVLSYKDEQYAIEGNEEFLFKSINGNFKGFNLNHSQWLEMLKALPYSKITINNFGDNNQEEGVGYFANFLSLTSEEDSNYYGIIAKVVLS